MSLFPHRSVPGLVPCVLLIFLGSSCSGPSSEDFNSLGWPKAIVFAYHVDDELPGLRYDATKAIADFLSRRLGIECSLKKTASYGPIIEAMRADKVDIAMLGTFGYILAEKKAGAECIVSRRNADGPIRYHSLILTKADRGIVDFEDLKARSRSFSFAFTNPASTSGHLIPRTFLESEGVFAEKDFRELIFPGKHNATLLSILSGQIDVGCISENTLQKLTMLDRVDREELKVLWNSPPIPSGCIAVRKELPENLKLRIQEEIVGMRENDPDAWEIAKRLYQYSTSPDAYYYASSDQEYAEIRELAGQLNQVRWAN